MRVGIVGSRRRTDREPVEACVSELPAETVITGGWTTRLEYRFSQFEQREPIFGTTMQPSNHTIRAGLSYKFGLGSGTSMAQAPD